MILKSQNSFVFDTPQRSHHLLEAKNFTDCDDENILGRGGFGIVVRLFLISF
jgi:hypothetical protein